ncbi:MAG TPA: cell division topological specificity factor MinE [Ktedonobacterales bacterium]|jgi:cell division topological specificity factor
MGLFDKLFGRKKQPAPSTSELARERLTLMLVHDRLKLTPDLLDRIKGELLEVISKYVEIDESGVDVELTHTEHSDKLVARMPVRRQRLHFERDVLEPGMGNPIVAAAALAKIHQPPADAASPPAAPEQASAPSSGDQTQEVSAPKTQETPAAPASEAAPVSETPAGSAEKGEESATPAATKAAATEAAAQPGAEAEQPAAAEAAPAPDAPQETPALPAEGSAAPAGDSAPGASAAEGTAPTETPAPAATPTKG